jgi:hypothetical protein
MPSYPMLSSPMLHLANSFIFTIWACCNASAPAWVRPAARLADGCRARIQTSRTTQKLNQRIPDNAEESNDGKLHWRH